MCTLCNRRQFLGATALGGAALASSSLLAQTAPAAAQSSPSPPATTGKVPIAVIVAGKAPDRSWSLSEAEVSALTRRLSEVERKLGNVEFVVGVASNAAETSELLEHAGPDAPVLAISADIFGLAQGVMPTVFKEARPVAVFHLPVIGGHDWCLVKPWREEGQRITLYNTTDSGDLEQAARALRVIPLLRRSRVLVSPPFKGTPAAHDAAQVKQRLGVEMVAIADGRYDAVMATVDQVAAEARADTWLREAQQLVEPSREDVVKAARAALTLDQLIAEHGARGLCVGTCMGWLPRGFPCLGFTELNDQGIPAACDGDMDCLLTMLILEHALNQPGFLGNAAGVDTSRNTFHLSHCSAPLRMEGRNGEAAPYLLRRHAEVRGGAVPEVHYRIGQTVTFTKLIHLDTLLVFTGKIVEAPTTPKGEERGCRTELVAQVSDADRLLDNWGGGALGSSAKDYYASLHRVAYYGDQTRTIRHLGHLLGLKVVAEC
ncbi:MAG TPA: twin-arginine translocation signal domain-containing protein [Verrucomicrobiota bacterium]|nr:twin-arginine translocation signal domain-containing protein [Verrucomicrobiota bacterium]HRZ35672.1 twin-arginine translocation signal domain-containing protein [Candidatus Paceibacterota bacterium]HRZ57772.1 twin-arginine translocation signal domain-containing protein [Candidatus Paceibacterota bacterium]